MNFFSRLSSLPQKLPINKDSLGPVLTCIAIGLVTFLVGFSASLPDDALKNRLQYELEQNLPVGITIKHVGFSLPFSIEAENVQIEFNDPTVPNLFFDTIKLTPHLASLIGNPGARFAATIGTGQIGGSVTQAGEISLDIDALNFDQPLQGFKSLRLSGQIDSARLDSHLRPGADTPSTVELRATELKLSGTRKAGLTVDQINFGQLNLQLGGTGRNLTVQKATLSSGDVSATAAGRIVIGRTMAATRLNLEVQIKPAASFDPSARSLFELIGSPGIDGGRKINIRGALTSPNLN